MEVLRAGLDQRKTAVEESLIGNTFQHKLDVSVADRGPANRKWARVEPPAMLLRGIRSIQRWCVVHPHHTGFLSAMALIASDGRSFMGMMARFSIALGTFGATERLRASMKRFVHAAGVRIRPLAERPAWIPGRIRQWVDLFLPCDIDSSLARHKARWLFMKWVTDLPSKRGVIICYTAQVGMTVARVLEGLDEVINTVFVPGNSPLRARHRWSEHEEMMEYHGRITSFKFAGQTVFDEAVRAGSGMEVGQPVSAEDAAEIQEEAGLAVLGQNVGGNAGGGYASIYKKNASKVSQWISDGAVIWITLARIVSGCWRNANR
jgi:hypothetical protein